MKALRDKTRGELDLIIFEGVSRGSNARTSDLKYAHERLNQMVSSDDCSGPLKRTGRQKFQAKEVPLKMSRESLGADIRGKERRC